MDETIEEASRAASAFGIGFADARSLCPYGPVYRLSTPRGDVVLKRTGFPRSPGAAIAGWLRGLARSGVDVVSPVPEFAPNPRRIDGAWPGEWVVYPFVRGDAYAGGIGEIAAAGRLLGRIHAAGVGLGAGMMEEPRLPLRTPAWIEEHAGRAARLVGEKAPALSGRWSALLRGRLHDHAGAAVRLSRLSLPVAACSWDYKASNLVYVSPDRPVLVDPDHAARIPRLYDLACALLLFHCDHPTSPGRLFTRAEWRAFLGGYGAAVALDADERAAWPDVLLAAWADQALWLIGNWPEGWDGGRDRGHLAGLAMADLRAFDLAAGQPPTPLSFGMGSA